VPGEAVIKEIRLLDAKAAPVASVSLDSLRPATIQIAAMIRDADALRIQTVPAGGDPAVFFAIGCLDGRSGWRRLSMVTTASATIVSAALIGLLIASVLVIGRAAFAPEPASELPSAPSPRRWLPALWLGVLFLVVFTAKLQLLHEYPVRVPFWDQWDGEARLVLSPFNDCGLSWRSMFAPHNEHRVFFTRLYALDLVLANGQWDPRVQQVCNAAIHTVTAVLVATIFWLAGNRRRLDLIVFVCAMVFAMPFAWENTIFAFQSPFYFLVLFSILALWLTTRYPPATLGWFLGWVWAACGLFTAASGVLITVSILAIVALNFASDRRVWRESLVNVAAAAPLLALGALLASPPLPGHASLKAHSASEFAVALSRALGWPWVDHPTLVLVLWLPLGLLLVMWVVRRGASTALERFAMGLGVWVVLHAGALAYGRGAGGAEPATRYMDFLSLGVVANAMALAAALDRGHTGRAIRQLQWVSLVGWLVLTGVGVLRLVDRTVATLDTWTGYFSAHVANVHRLVLSGDVKTFATKQPLAELPYPDPNRLAQFLQDPYIRRVLPSAVRAPLRMEPRTVTGNAFVPEGFYQIIPRDPLLHSWGSLSAAHNPAMGRFESQSLRCHGFLKFELAGYVGQPNQRLALKDLASAREFAVRAEQIPREQWLETLVPCPGGPFAIVAVDEDPATWFAFREPVEVPRGSLMAESLINSSSGLLVAALMLAFVAARLT
jgi:hypothetical protein